MPASSKRGLVAPQNTFLESIIRKLTSEFDNQCSFLLANSQLWDWPIVYANEGFCFITGIPRSDIIARSCVCEFMHGHLTDQDTVDKFRDELSQKNPAQIEIVLYTRDGTPLWFFIQIVGIKSEIDELLFFLLIFKDVTAEKQPIPEKPGKFSSFFTGALNKTIANVVPEEIKYKPQENKISRVSEVLNLNSEVLPKYHHEAPKTPRHIILHYGPFKILWDWIILVLTFYTAVIVPFNVAFQIKTKALAFGWLISDSIVDLIFLLDIVINFVTTFVGPSGEVISDPKIIRMNYIKSWFVVDLVSCLPYDMFNFLFYETYEGSSEEGITSLFSSLKVARLLRLGRIARKLDHYIEYGGAMLVLLVCFFGLSGHWLACIWYTIGSNELLSNGTLKATNWLVILGDQNGQQYYIEDEKVKGGPGTYEAYIAAFYFTMTSLTSVGFGNISANTTSEQIFSITMLIFGALVYATIFGNVTTIIQQMYAETNRFHDMLNSVREFLKLYQIPDSLSDRIMDYIISTWSMSKGIDTNKVLNYCPKDMKADICVHLNRKVFNNHTAFSLASDSCLRALAIEFIASHCAPGDMICHQGETIDSLNFVISGSLEVIQDDHVVAILSKGDVFGDCFWIKTDDRYPGIGHSASHVRALTYCDLNLIRRESLMRVLNFYESFASSFSKKMILTFNLRKRYFFRKISDIEKEKEEALRRKNDPTWEGNFPEDHFVFEVVRKFKERLAARKAKIAEKPKSGPKQGSKTTSSRKPKNDGTSNDSVDSISANMHSANNDDSCMVMDSEKMSTMFEAIVMQQEKINVLEKMMVDLKNSVQILVNRGSSNSNQNRNCNVIPEKTLSKQELLYYEKCRKYHHVEKKAKNISRKFKHRETKTADLIYMNEKTNQSLSSAHEQSSCKHSTNGLELVDLDNCDELNYR